MNLIQINQTFIYKSLNYFITLVWLVNGLFCKVLGLVPRHEQIVGRILSRDYSHVLTVLIGISEIVMAIWLLSNFKRRLNVITQIVVVAIMNIIEFILAPDLLLWGKFNSLYAFMFILVVFCNEFYYNKNRPTNTMLSSLKNHPFAVEAFFENSLVLTFAVPKTELENLIPEYLKLDLFENKWAFIAIALVQTKNLRPKGFPKFMGNDFFLIGYRVFVRYTNQAGKNLRGLYILKSETNKKKMELMGNTFTHYNYSTTDISCIQQSNVKKITSVKSNFKIIIDSTKEEIPLPANSPFADWKEARQYAGPLPFTFTATGKENEVLIIEGVRQNWQPKPVNIIEYDFEFLKSLNLQNPILANAFEINDIPYYWKKGKCEKWK